MLTAQRIWVAKDNMPEPLKRRHRRSQSQTPSKKSKRSTSETLTEKLLRRSMVDLSTPLLDNADKTASGPKKEN